MPSRATRRVSARVVWIAVPLLVGVVVLVVLRPWAGGSGATHQGVSNGPAAAPQTPAGPVAASVALTPDSSHLVIGDSLRLSASVRDGAGKVMPTAPVSWTSSDPRVADVSPDGVVRARRAGRAEVRSASGTAGATSVIVVEAPAGPVVASPTRPSSPSARASVAAVAVNPTSETLSVGQATRLTAAPRDASGNALTGRSVSWSSDDRDVATVDDHGLVTAVGEGTTAIRVSSGGRVGTASITVRPTPVATVEITPARQTLDPGDSVRLTATPRDGAGGALRNRSVQWKSTSASVASVSQDGRVKAAGPGSATITASSGSASGSATITVRAPAPPTSARPSPAVEPRVAVENVLTQYGRAIQNKDLAAIRSVFPDLPADKAKGWSTFFKTSTALSVTLDQVSITVTGDKARASFRQRMSYRSGGPTQALQQTVNAELARRGEAWVITAIN